MRTQPGALIRLVQALNHLHDLRYEGILHRGDHLPVGRARTRHEDDPTAPDPTGEQIVGKAAHHWRKRYEHHIARIETLALEIEDEMSGRDTRRERWRCTCGAYGRAIAAYCERCGKPRRQDATSQKV